VLTLRLLPVAPFGLVSYAFGATGVRLRAYLAGTALGAVPSTVVYATLGAHALSPGSPGFVYSLLAALVMSLTTSTTMVVLARRRRREASSRAVSATPAVADGAR
jgi:uncharacterized membrane protein YdjX (TVP38/TMEM64 family)